MLENTIQDNCFFTLANLNNLNILYQLYKDVIYEWIIDICFLQHWKSLIMSSKTCNKAETLSQYAIMRCMILKILTR